MAAQAANGLRARQARRAMERGAVRAMAARLGLVEPALLRYRRPRRGSLRAPGRQPAPCCSCPGQRIRPGRPGTAAAPALGLVDVLKVHLRPCCSRSAEPWMESCGIVCVVNCGFDEGFVFWVFCRKAEEYLRLSQVKCTGLMAQMTATSSAVMCLDLAASFMKQPVDKVRQSV